MDVKTFAFANLPIEARDAATAYLDAASRDERMEHLLHALHRVPDTVRKLTGQGIPEPVVRDTLADIGLHARRCLTETGGWGLCGSSPEWLKNHLDGTLFHVGRFQFKPRLFRADLNIRMYRHKVSARAVMLTAGEREFRGDGQVSGTNGIAAGDDGFRGYFHETQESVEGLLISPYGHAVNQPVCLQKSEWLEVIREDTPVLALHIPADGAFTPEVCRRSFIDMARFVREHSRALAVLTGVEGPFAAFTLGSWLLDAQLDGILPPESNLVQHLREYYLLPVLADESAVRYFVFNDNMPAPDDVPQDGPYTSLQRAILAFRRGGGHMKFNFGVILMDDVCYYGEARYRKES
jgi:hypothetical protein